MNQFIGIGRTTKDIEIKQTSTGKEYAIFQLAIARPYSTQKETDFIPCQVWNKQAIVLQKYCQKGSQIAIIGVLQSFKNKEDKTQWIVRVSNYDFLHTNNDLKKKIFYYLKNQMKLLKKNKSIIVQKILKNYSMVMIPFYEIKISSIISIFFNLKSALK